MVKDVLQSYTESKKIELSERADELVEDLKFKLEKTSIARPAVLGIVLNFSFFYLKHFQLIHIIGAFRNCIL